MNISKFWWILLACEVVSCKMFPYINGFLRKTILKQVLNEQNAKRLLE